MKKPLTLRKIVYYVCSYCNTKKPTGEFPSQCPNCGSFASTAIVREVNLGKRQPFLEDNREASPK